mmetsp:Transcript_27672/g.77381  ORF Transcript_27672/g.77381 Transcript_27672/m.77381 type:complete len:178 (+) Transcript_27672:32-565(+)
MALEMRTGKNKKYLLAHEKRLLADGKLVYASHANASALWLRAPEDSGGGCVDSVVKLYRPMGDREVLYLVEYGVLPSTQPYQAVMEGDRGKEYAEKYLNGRKKVDTHPTTVVEFCVPRGLVDELMRLQHKAEDGCVSMGLGNKAGNGLSRFNETLVQDGSWRIVTCKVSEKLRKRRP